MGPVALFDKSFLQSLSVDESVWFDHFFLSNVCPMFYVETLGDLEKAVRNGHTPDEVVGTIAEKFPEMSGSPCAFHGDLCTSNLLGNEIPMTGRIPLVAGKEVEADGKKGVVFGLSPEAEAFMRWQKRKFWEIERLFARLWRERLTSLDLENMAGRFKALGISGKSCRTLVEAKAIAAGEVSSQEMQFDRVSLWFLFLSIPKNLQREIIKRWISIDYPPLTEFAPYASYVGSAEKAHDFP